MNWRHRIAVVVLMYLAALPLAGTICAMTCVSGTAAIAAHHQDGQDCENAKPSQAAEMSASSASSESSGCHVKIGAFSASHCGDHGATLPQVTATAAQRADDLAVMSAPVTSDPVHPVFGSIAAFDAVFQYIPPPDSAPPTTTPLVLRV